MTSLAQTLVGSLAVTVAALLVLWGVGTARRDVSIVDPFWGLGFVIVGWVSRFLNAPGTARGWLILAMTTAWGLRLSLFLLWRNWGHGEDRRYAAMRAQHGDRFVWVSLFTVFLLQALILWFVALPVQLVMVFQSPAPLSWLDASGVVVWGVGLFFETVGDWQLARFKADPTHSGQVMDRGLWRYTRHPNYFGDFCVWWGLYLVAAAGGAWGSLLSPLLMSVLLMKVSGVTLLEGTIVERRPAYADYIRRTSSFFPKPPRSNA